ncbi:low molecular weight protein tyrosine phosphatase family protein [Rhizobacter sp. LjRoot28]|uniref:low molecular weight protein tyrosine phosphatase family protein n=1 Tax=Rhizobacter sp. LjRoot28 TaxID=3342309 RepID=UPI003ECFE6EE
MNADSALADLPAKLALPTGCCGLGQKRSLPLKAGPALQEFGWGQPSILPHVSEACDTQEKHMKPEHSTQTNVLFVCSRNQWRSPTAERVWRKHPALSVRSAGTSPNARHPVSVSDLTWAQVVFVMEEKHKSRLFSEYRRLVENLPIHVLDIPDEYKYMDPELVELLSQSVGAILDAPDGS